MHTCIYIYVFYLYIEYTPLLNVAEAPGSGLADRKGPHKGHGKHIGHQHQGYHPWPQDRDSCCHQLLLGFCIPHTTSYGLISGTSWEDLAANPGVGGEEACEADRSKGVPTAKKPKK